MSLQVLRSDALLFSAAVIWGFAFVAQRVGMDYIGPFTFNGVRFALGCITLLPFLVVGRRQQRTTGNVELQGNARKGIVGVSLAGLILFGGASLQQVGLVYTTAGKAGFITGLYVILVPILGLIWKQRTGAGTWFGACLAAFGLYLLSVTAGFAISWGDLLEFLGAFFWAGHVLIIGWLVRSTNPLRVAFLQYAICSILSLVVALSAEIVGTRGIYESLIPLLYSGVLSVGLAYTLQVVAQRGARPAHVAILLSLESVFAAIGGWLILGESLPFRGVAGCLLMLSGMLVTQLWETLKEAPAASSA